MKEVRNAKDKLVALIDEKTGTVIIALRGCTTKLNFNTDGTIEVVNTGEAA